MDPADVVSVPVDYSNAKARCCKYQILGVNTELTERRTSYISDYSKYGDGTTVDFSEDDDDDEDYSYYETDTYW